MTESRKFWRKLGVALKFRDPPNIPPYGWSYFDHLVAVYVNLNTSDPRADALINKSRERPDDLTWGDIFLLENINFSLMPDEVVARSAWILRERFREIASSCVMDKYVDSNIPKEADTPGKLVLLKADLTRLLDVLHWYYSLIPMRERMRKSLTVQCITMVVFYTALLGAGLIWCNWYPTVLGPDNTHFLAMLSSVVYFGIVGGFVSSQRRMLGLPNEGDPLISVFGLDNAGYYLWLSPMLGAIFAIILTLMFMAGILTGSIFPAFVPSAATADKLTHFSFGWNALPKDSAEYGKLFVWAFLSGFAERLVPDSLDSLASKLDSKSQASPAKQPAGPPGTPPPPIEPQRPLQPGDKISDAALQDALHTGEVPKAD